MTDQERAEAIKHCLMPLAPFVASHPFIQKAFQESGQRILDALASPWWIKCSERLPTNGAKVFAFSAPNVWPTIYHGRDGWEAPDTWIEPELVTHWLAAEPPKED